MENRMAKRTPRSEASDTTPASASSRRRGSSDRRPDRESDQRGIDPGPAPEALKVDAPGDSESSIDEPTADDIRVRAYHRYLERGGGHGMDFEDWLEAERELKTKR
jgi:hypothetical protein